MKANRLALITLLGGLLMAAIDVTIVNVAAPSIGADLGASGTSLVLVVSGYALAYAALLITAARLGDDRGHRTIFIAGLAGFTVASFVCGIAPTAAVLIVARVIQGAAGALMAPQILSIIQLTFEGERRAAALGLYATVLSLGAVLGQVVGGALVTADVLGLDWRPVFLVNVPIGIALLAIAPRALPKTRLPEPQPLDVIGAVLAAASVLALVMPAVLGRSEGWTAWTYASFAAGVVLTAVTIGYLRSKPAGTGIVDLAIFRLPNVAAAFGSVFASMVAYGAFLFTLTLLLQGAFGYTPLHSGLVFAPFAVGFAATSLTYPKLGALAAKVAPAAGLGVAAIGYVIAGLLASDGAWHSLAAAAALTVAGAGFGYGFSPVMGAALASVPSANAHDASGAISTTVQLGFIAGVAVFGTWFVGAAHPGHAFMVVGIAMAVLAEVAALLAARAFGLRLPARRAEVAYSSER
jgi:EmrB/QacA subfamily drug resistance transporter